MAVSFEPTGSGPIVAAFSRVSKERIGGLQPGIDAAFDPDRCPAENLPWLAHHYGVDVWSTAWTEAQKRTVVRDAYRNFRSRGTKSGIIAALGALASEVALVEWWEEAGVPGTARASVLTAATQDSIEAQNAINEVLARTRPYTRPIVLTVATLADVTATPRIGYRGIVVTTITANNPAVRP